MNKARKYLFDTHYHPEKPITLVGPNGKIENFEGAINTVEDMYKAMEMANQEGRILSEGIITNVLRNHLNRSKERCEELAKLIIEEHEKGTN